MITILKIQRRLFASLSLIFLGGCGANYYSVHHTDNIDSNSSVAISVDAKQRFLISNVGSKKTTTVSGSQTSPQSTSTAQETSRRYCTEPSPDVFTALSQALSANGSFGREGDPKSLNIAMQYAFSSSESAASISRTQTVNMLKEMMYRTCERYLNGQIGDLEYPTIAARDQRIMTSILAIEQLTGTLYPKPTVISTTGNASTGQATSDAIVILDKAAKNRDEKAKALEIAQTEFKDTDAPVGTCEKLVAKKPDDLATDEEKTKQKICIEKSAALEKAGNELKSAKAYYDTIASLAGKPGVSSATTNAVLLSAPQATEIDKQIEESRSQTIRQVAKVVEHIVDQSFRMSDETSFFCYRAIENKIDEVSKECTAFLVEKVKKDKEMLIK